LESRNDFRNYIRLPPELDPNQGRYEVIGALYGEKQSGKCWSERLVYILTDLGFTRFVSDPSVYKRNLEDSYHFIMLCIYVDDIVIISTDEEEIIKFKTDILKYVKEIKDLGNIDKYLGINVVRNTENNIIELSQLDYIQDFVTEYIDDNKTVRTSPLGTTIKYRELEDNDINPSLLPILGKIRYAADRTRPDMLTSCSILASHALKPDDHIVNAAIRSIQYLRSTKHLKLRVGGPDTNFKLFGFVDASTSMSGDSRPQIGICMYYNLTSGSFYSVSKLAKLVATSSTHAEIIAIDMFCKINENVRLFVKEMGADLSIPTTVYCDSEPSILLMDTLKQSNRTKHINLRINYIREQINLRNIELKFLPSELNVADVLTKPLTGDIFLKHRRKLLHGFDGREPEVVSSSK
jgi:hypothetical protein